VLIGPSFLGEGDQETATRSEERAEQAKAAIRKIVSICVCFSLFIQTPHKSKNVQTNETNETAVAAADQLVRDETLAKDQGRRQGEARRRSRKTQSYERLVCYCRQSF
jgi:hypothetical protein